MPFFREFVDDLRDLVPRKPSFPLPACESSVREPNRKGPSEVGEVARDTGKVI